MITGRVITAIRFLTIIPMGRKTTTSEDELIESLSYFPLAGFLQGIGIAVLAYILLQVVPPSIVSVFVIAFYIGTAGGFHQDGLSDTFDALSIKSSNDPSRDRDRRLRIMKDSTTGPIGVTAIILVLLMKFALLQVLLENSLIVACSFLLLLPVVSKWAMVIAMYGTKSAASGGLGSLFLERIKVKHVSLASVSLCCSAVLSYAFVRIISGSLHHELMIVWLLQLLFVSILVLVWKRIFTRHFGGLTGDNFGALHELAEIAYLTLAVLFI
ncbi:MAG TPA: adenosylcobinamide-GDP ribazoletransferase [Syntrophorhabdaceae bacterium]|nr:adenosylcobinamide-GDP ribazoletransferase [Syntrophorhabdaceae bacterium]